MKTPGDFLAAYLRATGHDAIRSNERNLNRLAIKLQRGRLGLTPGEFHGHPVEEHGGVTLIDGSGGTTAKLRADKKGKRVDLKIRLEFPKLVVDYGLWDYHTPLEKQLLLKQSHLTLQVIRDNLWDRNLVLASCPHEVAEFFANRGFFGDVLPGKFPGEAILLDPNAREELPAFNERGVYVLGGIVDKSNRIRTQTLGYDLPRASLRLEGRSSGVPDRLNLLAEIMCGNLAGTPLKKAIQRSRS
jgi:tRNA (adenine9-N1/guanine9-N1)-methyltransferase